MNSVSRRLTESIISLDMFAGEMRKPGFSKHTAIKIRLYGFKDFKNFNDIDVSLGIFRAAKGALSRQFLNLPIWLAFFI